MLKSLTCNLLLKSFKRTSENQLTVTEKGFMFPPQRQWGKEKNNNVHSFGKSEEWGIQLCLFPELVSFGVCVRRKNTCVCVCKNEAEMEDTRVLSTVWKERCLLWWLYKDINPRGDSWKALFPAEVFTRHSKIPQGIGTICITICCCLSGDPRDRIPLEKNAQFWVQPVVEESIGVQFVGKEEGVTPLQHYFAQEINKTLKLPLLPSICFSILVVGGVLFFFQLCHRSS